ncbi:protein CutA homolog isoform X3 [Scophthalmus maximus]|uniref:protein CutA homolog isoform X3 n=1 Tax=Scophthalmus maximus TaxID=52904 RepID=UPI001FA83FB0|nr:protein CutA homolog isoform X3 [Scophthalmus maximus]
MNFERSAPRPSSPAARPRTDGMEWLLQRCRREAVSPAAWRAALLASCGLLVLCVGVYPGLWSIGVRLHSAVTGSYVPGHHSVLLLNSPNEQVAKDIGRYYWKGEVQDASEILMLVKTKTSRIQQVTDYVNVCVGPISKVCASLCKPRSPQLPRGGRQSVVHEVDG